MERPTLADRARKALHRWLKHDPMLLVQCGLTASERAIMHSEIRAQIGWMDRAHRIVLSADFARFAAVYSKSRPEVLARNLPSAILPHCPLWIEWPERHGRWNGLAPGVDIPDFIASDVGFLIEPGVDERGSDVDDLYTVSIYYSNGTDSLDTPACGFAFALGVDGAASPRDDVHKTLRGVGVSPGVDRDAAVAGYMEKIDRTLIGRGYIDGHGVDMRSPAVRALLDLASLTCGVHSGTINTMIARTKTQGYEGALIAKLLANKIEQASVEINGDYRFLIALLTCINMEQRELRPEPVRSRGTVFVGGKIKPAYEYRILHLVRPIAGLTAKQITRRVTTSVTAARRRWHTVEAAWHYRRSSGRLDCDHAYQPIIDPKTGAPRAHDQQRCVHCGRLRWTVRAHARGDRSVGIIDKEKRFSTTGKRHIEVVRTVATLPDPVDDGAR